ncbi:MAG: HAMP domain-containing histidine kinase [Anaerolineae bacterium]|nr:HAMP domain-containing histidine kinase [Anaerolineae bacterium]NUQ02919.1 HAMP domain-containing histidine kinase [Anaerolineae bacterium]
MPGKRLTLYRLIYALGLILWGALTVYLLSLADQFSLTLISIRFASTLVIVWLMSGVGLLLVAVLNLARSRRLARHRLRQFQAMASALNEGLIWVNSRGKVLWHSDPAADLLDARGELDPQAADLLDRAGETGRTLLQTIPIGEAGRSLQAIPLERGTYALICRPVQASASQNTFYENFIRRIVHDMRNPLAAIIGHASNLSQSSADDPESWRRSARTIEDEAQRLTRLVDSMLFDARLAYVPLQLQPLDLADLLEEAVYAQDERALREGKTLQVEAPSSGRVVRGDRDLLVRAFENLIDNSLKYSGANGRLQIRLEDVNGVYRIQFMDNGEGIPPEYLPDRIFEPLVRARSHGSGSGLGLSIVRKIIAMHGGMITVQSRVGVGTTMTIDLPKSEG